MVANEDVNRHILAICNCFVTLFLVMDKVNNARLKKFSSLQDTHCAINVQPQVMTLEFASKVIQRFSGVYPRSSAEEKETALEALSRTRRLYDVSNILMNLRLPLLKKVRVTQVGSANKTFLQYVGPEMNDAEPLTEEDILALPDYRREHLFYSAGKRMWGIPERPVSLPGTRTVRLERNQSSSSFQVVDAGTGDGLVYLGRGVSTASALQPNKLLFADVVSPLSLDAIVALETEKMLASLRGSAGEKMEFAKRLVTSGDDGDDDSQVFTNISGQSEVYLARVTIQRC